MIKMTEDQRRTIRWEKVTRGPLTLAGVTTVATCRRNPLNSEDQRYAVCGFNGILRGALVWYTQPSQQVLAKDDQDQQVLKDRELCEIVGVTPAGAFQVVRLDPLTPDQCGEIFLTLPTNCEPTKESDIGNRVH